MDKVYQVIEGYYLYAETYETILGTYSTKEKAQNRIEKLTQAGFDPYHLFIKEVILDLDVDPTEFCLCG